MGGIYHYGVPSVNIYCNFTFDIRANNTISARWKMDGQYVAGRQMDRILNKSFYSGSSMLILKEPKLVQTGEIACEVSYAAGSPEQIFLATKTGFVNIAGTYIVNYIKIT